MIQSLVVIFCVLSTTALVGWISSSAMTAVRTAPDGSKHLEYSPALHAYGALMGLGAIAGIIGVGSVAVLDPASAAFVTLVSVGFLSICLWGLYAGYGGTLSYSTDGIYYRGLRANRFAKWNEISELRDGQFAQYILIERKPHVLSKGLRGFNDFANEAKRRGVTVDESLMTRPL